MNHFEKKYAPLEKAAVAIVRQRVEVDRLRGRLEAAQDAYRAAVGELKSLTLEYNDLTHTIYPSGAFNFQTDGPG